ncbi:TPA: GIY-YIG nuclease family protein [Clostridium botulinum]|uniref:GIY-YIG nuclease family protein n=1 Tax=Clostridium botulinum TaxID=1491 RepID=UPI0008FC4BD6|nr:GIY-YIG nuclease family protein [Clostridium botulinum]APC78911.1 meiotically up-regulated protein [Clostridium botulinum]MCS4446206.1 GIY-YIG nuclease family protein [Clostridium botulinum]MCS4456590.1 GIY-YIG nuclease family protein [Clostridium botulinum]MCS4461095.1 GIY-YIG nuclease family protein [Clostridium botulinum]MCS4513294.1 GIY-YIG nuclease family protein [Clostridium botulinum]
MKCNGYVYIIERRDKSIKIGKSINPESRVETLETQGGFIATNKFFSQECSNYSEIESKMHEIFNKYRTIGEWFNVDFDVAVQTLKQLNFKKPYAKEELEENLKEIGVFSKELMASFFSQGYERVEIEFNFNVWEPTKNDIEKAKREIKDYIQFCIEECEEYEWANEAKGKLNIIEESKDSKAIKEVIQNYYLDVFYSVEYEDLRKCLHDEEVDFIEKVLGIKYKAVNYMREALLNN